MMVFIVEDDDIVRIPLEDDLREAGYQVRSFADPLAALDVLPHCQVDVVITDVSMAPMNGLELISRIKHIKPSVKVIIMAANAILDSAEVLSALGNGYISKPFHVFQMLNLLDGINAELSV